MGWKKGSTEKQKVAQKVAQKNVWVVSLYTLFKGSLFFLFWLKKILQNEWVWFCYKAFLGSSKTHYCSLIRLKKEIVQEEKKIGY